MIPKLRKNRKPEESRFFSVFLIILFSIVIGFLIVSNIKINQKRNALNSRLESLKKEIQILEEKKEKFKVQISQTDLESYLEKEARERFNLKKPGEEVVVFIKEKNQPEKQAGEKKGLWQKIREKLKF